MDFAEGLYSVIGYNWRSSARDPIRPRNTPQGQTRMARHSAGKFIGLILGCLVVGVMLFMMFAVLGGLLSGD